MTAHLASYKGTQPGLSGLFNRAIRHGSRSIYSHTEVCIGNPFESEVLTFVVRTFRGGRALENVLEQTIAKMNEPKQPQLEQVKLAQSLQLE